MMLEIQRFLLVTILVEIDEKYSEEHFNRESGIGSLCLEEK